MKSSSFNIDVEIRKGIERWENEGGRIPFAAKVLNDSNYETESAYPFLNKAKRFVAPIADAHELRHEAFH